MKRKRKLIAGLLSASMLFGGMASGVSSAEETEKNTVIVALGEEPSGGFNPAANWGSGEHCHEPLIQSTLVATDLEMHIVNDLATEYSLSLIHI